MKVSIRKRGPSHAEQQKEDDPAYDPGTSAFGGCYEGLVKKSKPFIQVTKGD